MKAALLLAEVRDVVSDLSTRRTAPGAGGPLAGVTTYTKVLEAFMKFYSKAASIII